MRTRNFVLFLIAQGLLFVLLLNQLTIYRTKQIYAEQRHIINRCESKKQDDKQNVEQQERKRQARMHQQMDRRQHERQHGKQDQRQKQIQIQRQSCPICTVCKKQEPRDCTKQLERVRQQQKSKVQLYITQQCKSQQSPNNCQQQCEAIRKKEWRQVQDFIDQLERISKKVVALNRMEDIYHQRQQQI